MSPGLPPRRRCPLSRSSDQAEPVRRTFIQRHQARIERRRHRDEAGDRHRRLDVVMRQYTERDRPEDALHHLADDTRLARRFRHAPAQQCINPLQHRFQKMQQDGSVASHVIVGCNGRAARAVVRRPPHRIAASIGWANGPGVVAVQRIEGELVPFQGRVETAMRAQPARDRERHAEH